MTDEHEKMLREAAAHPDNADRRFEELFIVVDQLRDRIKELICETLDLREQLEKKDYADS